MKKIMKKLASRKLWMAVAGIAAGIAMALGADSTDVTAVTGAVTALVSAVTYIIVEGKVDAESVKNAAEHIQNAVEVLSDGDS